MRLGLIRPKAVARAPGICAGAMLVQTALNDAQENAQRCVELRPITLQKIAQPFGHRQHPLAHRQTREDMVGHAPGVARWEDSTAFAGEGEKEFVTTIILFRAVDAS